MGGRRNPKSDNITRRRKYLIRWTTFGEEATELRRRYNNSRRAFLADFRYDEASILGLLEDGMENFRIWEAEFHRRMQNKMKAAPLNNAGRKALETISAALTGNQPLSAANDMVFASIDFEGDAKGKRGYTGFGIATLNTRSLLGSSEVAARMSVRNSRSYNLGCKGFAFGDTERAQPENLRDKVIETLTIKEQALTEHKLSTIPLRKVIIVGFGLASEAKILEKPRHRPEKGSPTCHRDYRRCPLDKGGPGPNFSRWTTTLLARSQRPVSERTISLSWERRSLHASSAFGMRM